MRPVNKGAAPNTYTDYRDAANDLQDRLGDYCSYCERQIETHLAVEHIQPKSLNGTLKNDWSNFLLACVHCNSSKGDTPVTLTDYYWPDLDNTLRALAYRQGGIVEPNPNLAPPDQAKAIATITLTGLDKDPGNPDAARKPTGSDRRYLRRLHAWNLATRYSAKLAAEDTPNLREAIVDIALGRGMFSIWWTVFAGDTDIRRRLRLAFVHTETNCFDQNEDAVPHPTGQI
jgi:uncharacterized protein (TIGR02646 family)